MSVMRSRGTWAFSAAVGALVLAPAAAAHLSLDPNQVERGALVDLTFSVPNQDDPYDVDHVSLGMPPDFELDDAEAKPGWTQSRAGQSISWSEGRIPKGEYATFSIRGTAPKRVETVLFNVLVGDRTGKSITYRVGLHVVANTSSDSGARRLAKAALILAIVGAGLAVFAGFFGLYLWLRPPPV
jgi:uncharacterized protein YcnI